MSSNLDNNRSYFDLILNSSSKQQGALLSTITDPQVDLISEIFHNLLILPLESGQKQFIKKRIQFVKKISNNSKSYRYRRRLVIKHKKLVTKFLDFFKDELNSLI